MKAVGTLCGLALALLPACVRWERDFGGDLNGDGFDDVVIGATLLDGVGRAFVYHGGVGPEGRIVVSLDQDLSRLEEASSANLFGEQIVFGDLDGDEIDDLVVGVPGGSRPGGEGRSGRADVFLSEDGQLVGKQSIGPGASEVGGLPGVFGMALAFGRFGDADRLDLAGGAPGHPVGDQSQTGGSGAVFVFRNLLSANPNIPFPFNPNFAASRLQQGGSDDESEDRFGTSLASGDFNADGLEDLVVGVPGESARQGRVLVFGGREGPLEATRSLSGTAPGARFGHALAAGDFDDDGFADLAVGAPLENPNPQLLVPGHYFGLAESGGVHVFKGGPNGLETWGHLDQLSLERPEPGDRFGESLVAGDFDGDGIHDLAVAAVGEAIGDDPLPAPPGPDDQLAFPIIPKKPRSGAVYLFRGSAEGLAPWTRLDQQPLGENEGTDRFGYGLGSGDLNGDNIDDLIVGCPRVDATNDTTLRGEAYLFRGGPDGPVLDVRLESPVPSSDARDDQFGAGIAR